MAGYECCLISGFSTEALAQTGRSRTIVVGCNIATVVTGGTRQRYSSGWWLARALSQNRCWNRVAVGAEIPIVENRRVGVWGSVRGCLPTPEDRNWVERQTALLLITSLAIGVSRDVRNEK
jgi:hypothetical protein